MEGGKVMPTRRRVKCTGGRPDTSSPSQNDAWERRMVISSLSGEEKSVA